MPSDVLPLQRRSTRTRRTLFTLDTRARRLLSLAAFCLTIWLIYVSTIRSSSFKHDTRWAIIATPDDAEAPFILIDVRSDDLAIPVPLDDPQGLLSPSRFSPTHIATPPQDDGVFYIANEVTNGSIVAMELREDGSGRRWRGGTSDNRTARARVRQIVPSGGSEPCHLLASRDGRWLIAANYGSPSISLHRLPDLADSHILNLPLIDTGDSDRILSHPHQIIQHPSLSNTFFVTDLGQNLVHTVAVKNGRLVHRGIWKAHEQDVRGIRHGAFDAKNANIFFSYQNSASVLAVSLDDLGDIGKPVGPAVTTIPIALQNEPNVTLDVGDIKVLPSSIIIAANRRIAPPFAHIDAIGLAEEIGDGDRSLGGDTLVLMRHDPHGMAVQGHVELGCYQPRELLPLVQRTATYGGAREDEVLVSCHGANGRYGGARLVSVNQIPGVGPVAQVRRAWSAETAYMGMAWVV